MEKKLMDLYQLTMSYCDLKTGKADSKSCFDVFFRKQPFNGGYSVSGGLDRIIEFIQNFKFDETDIEYIRSLGKFDEEFLEYLRNFKFTGDIYAIPDGTPIFPGEPIITVYAPTIEAQIIETDLLNKFNFGTLITTKARRIVNELDGRSVMEFGARRAQEGDAATEGAKYAYVGGFAGTSCYEAGKKYGVPLLGTMAHSHIQKRATEYEAFLDYAKTYPNDTSLLVDTIDTLRSGIPNAIRVAKEYLIPNGHRLKAIRLDSGDLAYLSKKARKMLDEAGLTDTIIIASNSIDEYVVRDLSIQGDKINQFGIGEKVITASDCPVFGGVYKLSEIEENGEKTEKIKVSNTAAKITNPGHKKPYRFYDKYTGYAIADVIALSDESIPTEEYVLIDPENPTKRKKITNYTVRELQVPIFKNGELVYEQPSLKERREYSAREMDTLYPEVKRQLNPHTYYVDLTERLLELKTRLIEAASQEEVVYGGRVKS